MLPVKAKSSLVTALCDCAGAAGQRKARRFLQGLSADELQYIAGFLGAWTIASQLGGAVEIGAAARAFQRNARGETLHDEDLKNILLLEYLSLCVQS